MRPIDVDPEFFAPDEKLKCDLPLLDAWLAYRQYGLPLAGMNVLLVQHQLANQVPMVAALVKLGLDPSRIWWLDIPYTSHLEVQKYVQSNLGVPESHFARSDYRVLSPYAPYQHRRAVEMLHLIGTEDVPLLVLDDGAYILEALSTLSPTAHPSQISIVEQTTRGFIKYERSAMLRAVARQLPLVDVARSVPKRELEPPFIAMAVCASLQVQFERLLPKGISGNCLVLGYGAIGEQVAYFVRNHFKLPHASVHVHDTDVTRAGTARARGYPPWDRNDFDRRFQLVIGCSGQSSFGVGDSIFLEDDALLVSASSGAVELSRQDFIELADASLGDNVEILRGRIDEANVHADIPIRFVDRTTTFLNGGFPVNFDGRVTVCPTRYIQPTPTMMVAAAVQAAEALRSRRCGVVELEPAFCSWVAPAFRKLLGDKVHWLEPKPDAAW